MRRMRLTALAVTEAVKARALDLGFDRVAVGPAEAIPHAEAFERWLDAGYGEGMEWIGETRADRLGPGRPLPRVPSAGVGPAPYRSRCDPPRRGRRLPPDAGAAHPRRMPPRAS